jgi:iron(III) transport system substrate-binding protein
MRWRSLCRAGLGFALAFAPIAAVRSAAQEISSPAEAAAHPWVIPDVLARARKEGSLTIYSSTNEGEALPLWKTFENVTGVKVNFVRGSDSELVGRVVLEARARRSVWDLLDTTSDIKLPPSFLAQTDPPEAKNIVPQARDPDRRWYGVYANYNSPAYNVDRVKAADLPTTYEGFLDHKDWAGHVAIDETDDQWLSAIFAYYGDARARSLIENIVTTLKPVLVDGHLALARAVGSGDYWVALNNYVNLTINVKLSGAPIDYWGLDPVALFFGQIGVDAHAAHPNAALLGENFLLSKEGQTLLTRNGRIPVRPDVPPNPRDAVTKLGDRKLIATNFSTAKEAIWSKTFAQLFRAH